MRSIYQWLLGIAGCTFALCSPLAAEQHGTGTVKMGVVNTKKCLEDSKLGKQVQANFEKMKKQMESILQEKERDLEEIESKLNDDDYMDSISEDAASELKRKKRTLRAEGMQLQNQYIQTLQQANMKIVQELTEAISKASGQVAQDQTFDAIFSDEALTYYRETLDLTDKIVTQMNINFDKDQKDNPSKK
ncbi:MAG: OmpH family outer membrane protein [Parachlamydia sp.]|jgi:outer membrane protein|nr:OmpH family outer membrane protein [Parachlamydia sp.]